MCLNTRVVPSNYFLSVCVRVRRGDFVGCGYRCCTCAAVFVTQREEEVMMRRGSVNEG